MLRIEIERRTDESELDYHRRLVWGKLVDKTLSDYDYSEVAEALYGKPYSSDVARRMIYGSRKTLELLDTLPRTKRGALRENAVSTNAVFEMCELRKERQKLIDQRTALNKMMREQARQEEIVELISESVASKTLPELDYEFHDIADSDNDLLISLNDIHYGAVVDNYWRKYNSDICREMMQKYLDAVIRTAKRHESENCIVCCNGDIISGNIHYEISVTNKENVIQQITGASELIAEFLSCLSPYFKTVKFVSVAGNHSRLNPNKKMSLTDERLDDLTEWYLKARLQNFKNIEIGFGDRIDPTMYVINVRGRVYCGVHGDYDGSDSKINALQTMIGAPLAGVLVGHLHHNEVRNVDGIKVMMGGSFLGADSYAVSKRLVGKPEQMIAVCTDDGVLCTYDIDLS